MLELQVLAISHASHVGFLTIIALQWYRSLIVKRPIDFLRMLYYPRLISWTQFKMGQFQEFTVNDCCKTLPLTGLEPRSSGTGSSCSANASVLFFFAKAYTLIHNACCYAEPIIEPRSEVSLSTMTPLLQRKKRIPNWRNCGWPDENRC